jgi:hypothetical protein
MRAI